MPIINRNLNWCSLQSQLTTLCSTAGHCENSWQRIMCWLITRRKSRACSTLRRPSSEVVNLSDLRCLASIYRLLVNSWMASLPSIFAKSFTSPISEMNHTYILTCLLYVGNILIDTTQRGGICDIHADATRNKRKPLRIFNANNSTRQTDIKGAVKSK